METFYETINLETRKDWLSISSLRFTPAGDLLMDYELDVAEDALETKIEKEVTPMSATG